jgi:chromosome partitioning protein
MQCALQSKGGLSMPIITVGSSKGGCGKTTTVLALASEIRSAGQGVCIIDADDQLSAYSWYQKWQAKDHITVVDASNLSRDIDILGHIKKAAAEFSFVIIDPAGMRSQRMQWAASLSDLWIIPQKATSLDAAATANLLDVDMDAVVGMRGGRSIAHRILFTMTNPLILSRNERHIVNATKAKAPVFDEELRQYDAYSAMDLYGLTLEEVATEGVANAEKPRKYAAQILRQAIEDIKAATKGEGS